MIEPMTATGQQARITFDGELVTIERGRRGSLRGQLTKTIPVSKIQAVQYRPAHRGKLNRTPGFLRFTVAGATEHELGLGIVRAARDENAVVIKPKAGQIAEFDALVTAVRERL